MNRLIKVTASAMLLTLVTSAPALAMYDPSAPAQTEPGVIRILQAPADQSVSSPANPGEIRILPAPVDRPVPISAPAEQPVLISAPAGAEVLGVQATRAEPTAILVNNSLLTYDQKPLVQDGTLMVPLRAIVEGAGGTVNWDGVTKTVTVRLGDRTALFVIGATEAEMNQDNVRYFQRNMIRMAKAPVLAGGRTLIAADALTNVLGLLERPDAAGALSLVPNGKLRETAPPTAPAEEQNWIRGGTLKEIKYNFDGSTSILVEGEPMANGESSLTWFVLSDSTKISVKENGVEREGSQSDLATAYTLKVDVRSAGPLLMSYPARGSAAAIVIHK